MMLDMKRTFDEVVLAHTDPASAPGDLRQPLLPGHELDVLRHAGVHGDGEAGPAARPRRVGPDRGRHPAVALGAGLPRRAGPAVPLPRRPDAAAAAGAGARRRPERVQPGHRLVRDVLPGGAEDARRAAADRPVRLRRRAGLDVRRLPRAGRADLPGPAGPGDGVPAGRGAGAGRGPGGRLLRRAARRGADAAGRAGAQPGAPAGRAELSARARAWPPPSGWPSWAGTRPTVEALRVHAALAEQAAREQRVAPRVHRRVPRGAGRWR